VGEHTQHDQSAAEKPRSAVNAAEFGQTEAALGVEEEVLFVSG
jgi:hypothetical protein